MRAHSNPAPGSASGKSFDPAVRGYIIHYHAGEPNHCPGCGRSQWLVGRTVAECAYCETALPLDHGASQGLIARFVHTRGPIAEVDAGQLPLA